MTAQTAHNLYSISQIAEILEVSQQTIRHWERDGHFSPTHRTSRGHRRYTIKDLEKLQKVKQKINSKEFISRISTAKTQSKATVSRIYDATDNNRKIALAVLALGFIAILGYFQNASAIQKILDRMSSTKSNEKVLQATDASGSELGSGPELGQAQLGEMRLSGIIIADDRAAFYPIDGDNRSLGFDGHPWYSLYLKNASIDEKGNLDVGGEAIIAENADFKSKVTIRGELDVDRNVRLRGENVSIGESDQVTNTTLNVYSPTTFSSTMTVSGATNFTTDPSISGTTNTSFTIDTDSTGTSDTDLFLYFEDDGIATAHSLKWDDGNDRFEFDNDLYAAGALTLTGAIIVPGTTTLNTVAYTWPGSDGSASQVLSTNASGTLSWTTIGAASIGDDSLDFDKFVDSMTLDANLAINIYDTTNTIDRDFRFYNSDSSDELLFLDGSTGNLGIGTTSPQEVLHVHSASSTEGIRISSALNTAILDLWQTNESSPNARNWQLASNNNNFGDLSFVVSTDSSSAPSSEVITFNSSGNIGIGTWLPQTNIHILDTGSAGTPTLNGNTLLSLQRTGDPGHDAYMSIIAGTAASSQIFFGDTDAEIRGRVGYDHGGDYMYLYTTGSERVRINSTGNLGIGTTAPASILQIAGTFLPTADDTYDIGSNTLRWRDAYYGPGSLHIGTSTSDEYTVSYDTNQNFLGFNYNGSGDPEAVLTSSGNLGIGVTGPEKELHILIGGNVNTAAISSGLVIEDSSADSPGINILSSTSSRAGIMFGDSDDADIGAIYYDHSQNSLDFYTNVTEKMTLNSSGNLGIGNSTPATALNVEGTIRADGAEDSVGLQTYPSENPPSDGWYNSPILRLTAVENNDLGGIAYYNADILHAASSGVRRIQFALGTQNMSFTSTGLLGIGTSSPGSELHIAGTTPQVRIGDDGAEDTSLVFMGNAQDFYIALDDTTDDLTIGTGTTIGSNTLMVIENGGNVGIGTTAPGAKLEVDGGDLILTGTATNHLVLPLNNDGATPTLGFGDGDSGIYNAADDTLGVSTGGGAKWFFDSNTFRAQDSRNIGFGSGNDSIIYYDGSDTIWNLQNVGTGDLGITGGNVGIGTTAPAVALEVTGNIRLGGGSRNLEFSDTSVKIGRETHDLVLTGHTSAGTNIMFKSGSTENMRITNAGNVGIGTTTPGYTLEVAGTGYFSGALTAVGGLTPGGNITMADDEWIGLGASAGRLIFDDQATDDLSIMNANVGIGTTGPSYALDLLTTTQGGAVLRAIANNDVTNGGNMVFNGNSYHGQLHIQSHRTNSSDALLTLQPTTDNKTWVIAVDDSESQKLKINSAQSEGYSASATSGTNVLTLEQGGNVGIGTTEPGAKLHLYGASVGIRLEDDDGEYADLFTDNFGSINLSADPGNTGSPSTIRLSTDGSEKMRLSAAGGLSLGNSYVGTDAGAGNMIISGNVGIGTTSPNQSLSIASTDASNVIDIYHDNTDAIFNTDDGSFLFQTLEDAHAYLDLKPHTSANHRTFLRLYRTTGAAAMTLSGQIHNTDTGITVEAVETSGNVFLDPNGIGDVVITSDSDTYLVGSTSSGGDLFIAGTTHATAGDIFLNPDGGNVGIGTTAPGAVFEVNGTVRLPNLTAEDVNQDALCIQADGDVVQDSSDACDATSSERYKENIEDLGYGLAEINALSPAFFDWKEQYIHDRHDDRRQIGLIAEDLAVVMPELVFFDEEGLPHGVDYKSFTAVLARSVQELNAKVENMTPGAGYDGDDTSGELFDKIQDTYDEFKDFVSALGMSAEVDEDGNELLTVSSDLAVLGNATMTNATITNTLAVGLVQIDSLENSINVLGSDTTLNLQGDSLLVNSDGNVIVKGTIKADKYLVNTQDDDVEGASAGKAVIKAGELAITQASNVLTSDSLIFVTPQIPVKIGAKVIDDNEFEMRLSTEHAEDIIVSWWIIN